MTTYKDTTKKTWDLIFSMYEIKMKEDPLYNFVKIKKKFGLNTSSANSLLDYLESRKVIYMKKEKNSKLYDLTDEAVTMVEDFQKNPELFKTMKKMGVYPFGRDIPKKKALV